ncbi:tyrosine-protein phosphatase [Conyzicola sp.]|uniref:tyrosine-protein phosphatase n=1 Tax=Conyzicola sp. TaxID=1969404 RepID=UPI003989B7CA
MQSLEIAGTFNARWVATAAAGRLARSAALDDIGETGTGQLGDSRIDLVLDLRETSERGVPPHDVAVAHVPLYRLPDGPPIDGTLERVYDFLITQRGSELGEAVGVIADARGPVLVHCTAGKDRTGLVVALALLASGHTERQVVDDYVLSTGVVRERRFAIAESTLLALGLDPADHADAMRLHLDSPAEAIEHALRTLDGFGGPEAYLIRNGVTAQQLRSLRENLGGQTDDTD